MKNEYAEPNLSFKRNTPILTEEWYPSHPEFEYPEEFVRWVDSINSGFQNRIYYQPFDLYCQQAEQWMNDNTEIQDYDNEDDQLEWLEEEIEKCRVNTLYFSNKYGFIKENNAPDGKLAYKAWEAQKILLFIFDCGYSILCGKGRQIGFTTTMCIAGMKRVNLNKSYFIKFITHSREKGEEIFRDKVKWTYTKLPGYISQEVKNWTANLMNMDKKGDKKGKDEGGASMFQVDSPSVTAINGGSPSCVFVDEIGLFEIFGEMMREGRPALFKYNPETDKMTMQQQFMAWGTSGDMDKGGSVFEAEFRRCLEEWRARNFTYGIIPLFFNAYARNGVTEKFLKNEFKAYQAQAGGRGEEAAKVQFYQAYPITIEDMFLRKANTLVPVNYCNDRIRQIYGMDVPIEYGYFEPIFDMSVPTPDAFVPYKIKGARWVFTGDREHVMTSTVIINHPPKNECWKHRYFQGTDPINSETGHSKMASAIWDSLTNSVSALLVHRERKFKETYLQCLLLSLYYDQQNQGGVKELIENNIGDMYLDFQEVLGFKNKFTSNSALPEYLRSFGGKWFGISNKVNTAPRILAKLEELLDAYGDNINVPILWEELKTFVEKDLKASQSHRQTRYQAADARYDRDDSIFAITFAYINALCYVKYDPENIKRIDGEKKTFTRYVQSRETSFRMKLCTVDENGKILRVNEKK